MDPHALNAHHLACWKQGTNSYDLFVRGADNQLWCRRETLGSWGVWKSLNGYLTSSPGAGAVVNGVGVAVRGGDGAVYYKHTSDGGTTWSSWVPLGGSIAGAPAVTSWSGFGIEIFARGADNACWQKSYDQIDLMWGSWHSLGGKLSSSPAAFSRGTNLMDVYAAGTNGQVYENFYNTAGWHTWGSIGGQVAPGTGPGVSGWTGHDIVFVRGTNSALYQRVWSDSTGWTGWTSLGGNIISSPAAASHGANTTDVFAICINSTMWSKWTTSGGTSWSPWYQII
jgi:hypothetical protein